MPSGVGSPTRMRVDCLCSVSPVEVFFTEGNSSVLVCRATRRGKKKDLLTPEGKSRMEGVALGLKKSGAGAVLVAKIPPPTAGALRWPLTAKQLRAVAR